MIHISDNVQRLAEILKAEVDKRGMEAVREFFSNPNLLSNDLSDSQDIEYIKRMILAQFHISDMIYTHANPNIEKFSVQDIEHEEEKFYKKIDSSRTLLFSEDELDMLFGNPLNIKSQTDYNKINNYYYHTYSYDVFKNMYEREKLKHDKEKSNNLFKKILISRKIKKLEKGLYLSHVGAGPIKELIRVEYQRNPEADMFDVYKKIHKEIDRGLYEASRLFEAEDIVKMSLLSLKTQGKGPINLESVGRTFREEMTNTYSLMKEKVGYRTVEVSLGGFGKPKIKAPKAEKIPEEMKKLQQEYEEAYGSSKTKEEYLRRTARIFTKFISLQPYEDCNKRTGMCLLNAMLLSKGIRPIPFSMTHSQYYSNRDMIDAFDRALEGNHELLENLVIESYRRNEEQKKPQTELPKEKEAKKEEHQI